MEDTLNNAIERYFGDAEARQALVDRIERITEIPLLLLAFVMVPVLAASVFWELTPTGDRVVFYLDIAVWAAFALDLGIKLIISPNRLAFLRRHWLDVLIVAFPYFRPLRIVRTFLYGARALGGLAKLVHIDFLLVYAIGLVLTVATIVTTVEAGHDSPLGSFNNSLWWALTTVTTVGYGDMVPATPIGRAGGVVLMLGGIGIFGALTANLARMFVRQDTSVATNEKLLEEVVALRQEVAELKAQQRG